MLINPRNSRDIFGVFGQGNYRFASALELALWRVLTGGAGRLCHQCGG